MSDYQKTFGPVVIERDGEMVAKCQSGRFDCAGRLGNSCLWNSGTLRLPADMWTPDWCQYKLSALRDAEEMKK
jgi:hypothetical protein